MVAGGPHSATDGCFCNLAVAEALLPHSTTSFSAMEGSRSSEALRPLHIEAELHLSGCATPTTRSAATMPTAVCEGSARSCRPRSLPGAAELEADRARRRRRGGPAYQDPTRRWWSRPSRASPPRAQLRRHLRCGRKRASGVGDGR